MGLQRVISVCGVLLYCGGLEEMGSRGDGVPRGYEGDTSSPAAPSSFWLSCIGSLEL